MPRQRSDSSSTLDTFVTVHSLKYKNNEKAWTMGKLVILVALCALCTHAAPAPADIKETGLTRPSPINPAVLSDPKPAEKVVLLSAAEPSKTNDDKPLPPLVDAQHRKKRDETPPPKPHSVVASEKLHGQPSAEAPEKPDSVKAWEGLQHNPSKTIGDEPLPPLVHAQHREKRDETPPPKPHSVVASEKLHGQPSAEAPEKPDSVKAWEGLQHDPSKTHNDKSRLPLVAFQHREKRNETPPPKPHSVVASEKLHGQPSAEAPEKPDSVKAREGLQHDPSRNIHRPTLLHAEHQPDHKQKRDIPVPTEIKTKPVPKEVKPHEAAVNAEAAPQVESHGPLRPHPVPVSEFFNKAKPSSSEESKESAEKEGTKA